MNVSDFLRVERDNRDGPQHYVVHTHDPKFTLELVPDGTAPDKIGRGLIKRVHVPNSWAGDYTKYSKFISAAQEFFMESFAEPAPKSETPALREASHGGCTGDDPGNRPNPFYRRERRERREGSGGRGAV